MEGAYVCLFVNEHEQEFFLCRTKEDALRMELDIIHQEWEGEEPFEDTPDNRYDFWDLAGQERNLKWDVSYCNFVEWTKEEGT